MSTDIAGVQPNEIDAELEARLLSLFGNTFSPPPLRHTASDQHDDADVARITEIELQRQAWFQRLRPNRGDQQITHTYADQDVSDDWNPESGDNGGRKAKSTQYKDPAQRKQEDQERQERRATEYRLILQKCLQHSHKECTAVVTLRLTNDELRAKAGAIPDTWPEGACFVRSIRFKETMWETNISETNIINVERRPLVRVTEGPNDSSTLIGHGEYQGCWSCAKLGEDCSLRKDNPYKWPCDACVATGDDCELVRPAVRKRRCQTCEVKKEPCTFSYNPEADGPCDYCESHEVHCIAGPRKDGFPNRYICEAPGRSARPKVFDSELPELLRDRCSHCEEVGADCTLYAPTGKNPVSKEPPCKRCMMENKECSGLPLASKFVTRTSSSKKRSRLKKNMDLLEEPSDGDDTYNDKAARRTKSGRKKVRILETAVDEEDGLRWTSSSDEDGLFVRPAKQVRRNSDDQASPGAAMMSGALDPPQAEPESRLFHPVLYNQEICSLCACFKYAFLGKHAKTKVQEWQSTDHEGTFVCENCTKHRMAILCCPAHDLVEYSFSSIANFTDMINRLLVDQATTGDPFCSLCPAMATHRCQNGGDDETGCGLLLCTTCWKGLRRCKGSFGDFVEGTPATKTSVRPLGMRADVELLKEGGDLSNHILSGH